MSAIFESQVTPRDVARVLFRHWRKITLIFCGVVGLSLLAIALLPRSYVSEAKLMIRMGRESVGLDPTATTGETVMLQKTQDEEVNSAVNIFLGRELLERVVEKVGADRILDDAQSGRPAGSQQISTVQSVLASINDAMVSLRLSDPGTKVDQAVRRLEKRTTVTAPKLSTVITVRYTAASPELAHDVVATLTSVFLEDHSRLNQSDGSLQFFATQTDKLFKDLTAAQEKLRDRKNAYQLTSAENRRSMVEQTKDAMRRKVYELQMQENDLMSRYTDEFPPLKEIRRQRELAERALMEPSPPSVASEPPTATNANDDSVADRPRTKASPAVLQLASVGTEQQGRLASELQRLNDQELELAQLEREVKLLEGKYAMHVEKLEQARVNEALSRDGISNVKVAQQASTVHKPVSPKKSLLLAGGLMVAFIGAAGSALAAERFDQTLRTTAQVEQQLNLPVLASIRYRKGSRKPRQRVSTAKSIANSTSSGSPPAIENDRQRGSYRNLVAALRSAGGNGAGRCRTVGVVGCDGSKLRSQVARNLAKAAAHSGTEPVMLIDADAERRRISNTFQLNGAPGWRDLLAGVAVTSDCVRQSTTGNLAVMGPGGTIGAITPADGTTEAMAQLDGIATDYGFVVVDLPSNGGMDGHPCAGEWFDEAILVIDAERTRIQAAQRTKDMLQRAGVQVTGVVLANRRDYIPRWLYQRL